ncbi:MAG: hypothetical protein KDD45_00600 [Bdellovibrionales bacterium]|nr:hypothetical protein [Bdellovibrionales bacterium]
MQEKLLKSGAQIKAKTALKAKEIKLSLELLAQKFVTWARELGGSVVGGLEKGVEAAKVASPPKTIIEGVDISKVANYVGFKAAMTKNKMTLELVGLVQAVFIVCLIFYSLSLTKELRKTSFLMVPSQINGVTEVIPNDLPPSRIHKAFVHYVGLLGNIDPTNIREHYNMLKEHMSKELRINFTIETAPTIKYVLEEGLSEYVKVGEKTVEPDGKGWFRVTAPVKVFPHLNGQKLEPRSEYIVMKLKIVAPNNANTWALQIVNLKRISAKSFNSMSRLKKGL